MSVLMFKQGVGVLWAFISPKRLEILDDLMYVFVQIEDYY